MSDPYKPEPGPNKSSQWFWVLLVAPAFFSLTGYLVGTGERPMRDVATVIVFLSCLSGLFCSIFCGIWLARRFCRPGERVLGAVGLILVIGLVNLFIVAVGFVPVVLNGGVGGVRFRD
jgi:hypothetical protein